MLARKRKKLEARGWKVGSAEDFLGLSEQESAYIELKLRLADCLRERRLSRKLTQVQLARLMHSSQSRIAKMESGAPDVSVDLLIKSLFALGASRKELSSVLAA